MARPARPKKVAYDLIREREEPAMYAMLAEVVGEHHDDLAEARICMAWRRGLKPDADHKLTLGKCQKVSDLNKEMMAWDFVLVLNREAWQDFDDLQRRALLHHECCHAAPARNRDGSQKEDERGRKVWRLRKHDIEEFQSVVANFGLYKQDLADFARICSEKRQSPLFADAPDADGNGHAAGDEANGAKGTGRRKQKVG